MPNESRALGMLAPAMNRRCLSLLAAAALLASSGCAVFDPARGLQVGVSQQPDIVARQGQPSRVWRERDGGSTLEFATQPFGETCFMFRLDAAGRLVDIRDTLLRSVREQVEPGWTMDQVSRLLGQERQRVYFRFSGEEVWDWNVRPDSSSGLLRFNVHFKEGVVHRTSHSLLTLGRSTLSGR